MLGNLCLEVRNQTMLFICRELFAMIMYSLTIGPATIVQIEGQTDHRAIFHKGRCIPPNDIFEANGERKELLKHRIRNKVCLEGSLTGNPCVDR